MFVRAKGMTSARPKTILFCVLALEYVPEVCTYPAIVAVSYCRYDCFKKLMMVCLQGVTRR